MFELLLMQDLRCYTHCVLLLHLIAHLWAYEIRSSYLAQIGFVCCHWPNESGSWGVPPLVPLRGRVFRPICVAIWHPRRCRRRSTGGRRPSALISIGRPHEHEIMSGWQKYVYSCPHPPPPGVAMPMRSPARAWMVVLPGRRWGSEPSPGISQFSPRAPGSPPANP